MFIFAELQKTDEIKFYSDQHLPFEIYSGGERRLFCLKKQIRLFTKFYRLLRNEENQAGLSADACEGIILSRSFRIGYSTSFAVPIPRIKVPDQ